MWHVYELTDPRDDSVFYVGCSVNPQRRFLTHKYNPLKSISGRVRELKSSGLGFGLRIESSHDTKTAARVREHNLILETPTALNVDRCEPWWPGCSVGEPPIERKNAVQENRT